MNILENIRKVKKIKGYTWDKLAEDLPISGNALAVAFNRKSVDKAYLQFICEKLDIDYKENVVEEPSVNYEKKAKSISLLEIRDDLKDDLNFLKQNTSKTKHIQDLADSLTINFENISGALIKILQHNEKVENFIDQINVNELKDATKKLNQLNQ